MKKVFRLQQENKHPDRLLEAVKHEIRKYLKRERNKKLPEEALYWDFDCRFGQSGDTSESLPASAIIGALDKAHEASWETCYVEIVAKAAVKTAPTPESEA